MKANIDPIGDFSTSPIPGVHFQCLSAPDHALPAPPRFTFGPFPPTLMDSYYGHWGIGSVGVFTLHDIELSGTFLISRDNTYFRCPELNIHEAHINEELTRIASIGKPLSRRRLAGKHVCLAGPGYGVYGHWLVEYLPKISLLNFTDHDIHGLKYLLADTTPRYVFDWLKLLGIPSENIVQYDPNSEAIVLDEALFPTIMHNGVRMSPIFSDAASFMKGLISLKLDTEAPSFPSRIFLSRARASQGRSLRSRERVEELAANANFSIVFPETMDLADQVRLFSGAKEIMGEYGSAMHGSLFSSQGTVVCALRGTRIHPGFLQSGLGTSLKHPTGYIFGEVENEDPNSAFAVSEENVMTALRLVFGGLNLG